MTSLGYCAVKPTIKVFVFVGVGTISGNVISTPGFEAVLTKLLILSK